MTTKINDIVIPVKYELRNITKEKSQQYGKDTYLYEYTIYANGRRLTTNSSHAQNKRDLISKFLETFL